MFITVDDAKIFATAFGDPIAPAIVGIGGWTGNWELWLDPLTLLSNQWHTIAYDHRGAGATIASVESITLERLVDDLFFVMDTFGVQRAVIAAESAGARTALAAALKHPKRVSALVLVDGLVQNDTPEEKDAFMANLQANFPGTLQGFINACLPDPNHAHLRRWGMQMLTRATPESAMQLLRVNKTPDLPRTSSASPNRHCSSTVRAMRLLRSNPRLAGHRITSRAIIPFRQRRTCPHPHTSGRGGASDEDYLKYV